MRMHNLRHVLQHIVYGFDNVSLAQHHSVIERLHHVYFMLDTAPND